MEIDESSSNLVSGENVEIAPSDNNQAVSNVIDRDETTQEYHVNNEILIIANENDPNFGQLNLHNSGPLQISSIVLNSLSAGSLGQLQVNNPNNVINVPDDEIEEGLIHTIDIFKQKYVNNNNNNSRNSTKSSQTEEILLTH